MTSPNIVVLDNPEQVSRAAAQRFVTLAQGAIAACGHFGVSLAGGSTPKRSYELLATEDYKHRVDWPRVHIFFGDERCVPPDDPQSNYRMVRESLLSRVPIPGDHIHRMRGEDDPVDAVRLYEKELRLFFASAPWPRFDLIFLGMGDDGHTASLFPGTGALKETRAWVVANWVEKLGTYRITLTAPAMNHGSHIAFLVTGKEKAARLAEVIRGPRDPERLPAQLIEPIDGSLEWIVDKPAAVDL